MEAYNLKKFSEELKKQRVKKKISLLQIKNRTRIDVQYLEAIEESNFDVMPEVYIRAFIREYAETIGLDPKETLEKYDAAKKGKILKKEKEEEIERKEELKFEEENLSETPQAPQEAFKPWMLPAIVGGTIVLLALIVYLAFFNSKDEIIVKEKPYEEVLQENKSRFELTEKEKKNVPVKVNTDSLLLKIIAKDTSWCNVVADGKVSKDFILYPQRTKKLKALNYFDVRIGNSGGVKILLNGDTLDFKGAKGKARHVLIDKEGIKPVKVQKKNE